MNLSVIMDNLQLGLRACGSINVKAELVLSSDDSAIDLSRAGRYGPQKIMTIKFCISVDIDYYHDKFHVHYFLV